MIVNNLEYKEINRTCCQHSVVGFATSEMSLRDPDFEYIDKFITEDRVVILETVDVGQSVAINSVWGKTEDMRYLLEAACLYNEIDSPTFKSPSYLIRLVANLIGIRCKIV